jgi:radical SAM superfamily enzyme YgiQ (UPF0313 family)
MELPRRKPDDVYLPDGTLQETIAAFRQRTDCHDLRIAIAYAFDFRTRMLPYWYADKRMAPCSVRTLGEILHACGFKHIRIVLQQWTPNFKPSKAILDGRPLDILLVSAMQVHGEPSYDLVRDAHQLGADRPLILAGGPKAIYEPTDYFELEPGVGADCVVTGEAFVLLDLLKKILDSRQSGDSVRDAFERARHGGGLKDSPGLVYLSPEATHDRPVAVNTGVQRLLKDLDELPMPDAGYRMIEPPHRRRTLADQPCPPNKVGKLSVICSVIATHGCKFNCDYCPIPAVNQRTWRYKSPQRMADEIAHIYETFGIVEFFGTDDNFFNTRETVVALFTAMAEKRLSDGTPLGERIRFYTEGTEFDVHKNRDLLPLCKKGGMSAIWFGIEDITAELINKGQTQGKTAELFELLNTLGIEPMAMMMHSDGQPFRTPAGDLHGVANQARYLFDKGAVSYQCTYLSPAIGTRTIEPMVREGMLYDTVNGENIPLAYLDGNHVVASKSATPWERQMNVVRAYATFYNPLNTLRVIRNWRKDRLVAKRLLFQIIGQIGLVMTAPKLWRWSRRLKKGPIKKWDGLIEAPIPMIDAHTSREVNWSVERIPSSFLPQPPAVEMRVPPDSVPARPTNGKGKHIGLPIAGPQPTFASK